MDNTPFPPEKFRIGSFGRSNVSVVQLLAVTERVGIGAEPETFVTPAHSIPPLVPPSAPIIRKGEGSPSAPSVHLAASNRGIDIAASYRACGKEA